MAGGEPIDAWCSTLACKTPARVNPVGRLRGLNCLEPQLGDARSSSGFFRDKRRQNPPGPTLFALVTRNLLRVPEPPPPAGALLAQLASQPLEQSGGLA